MIKIKTIKTLEELEQFKKDHNLKEYLQFFKGGFYSKENSNKKRYIIKKWYWHGEWANPTKETYCYLIER